MRRRIGAIADGVYRTVDLDRVGRRVLRGPVHAHRRRRPPGLRLHRRVTADAALLQLEAVHHRERARRRCCGTLLASDLPFNDGHLRPFELRCPEGRSSNSEPPAPIAAAHMHVGAQRGRRRRCRRSISRSRRHPTRRAPARLTGAGRQSALGDHTWSCTGSTAPPTRSSCSTATGSAARPASTRDGIDLGPQPRRARRPATSSPTSRSSSRGTRCSSPSAGVAAPTGAGEHHAGGGNQLRLRPHGIDQLDGTMFGMRRWLPLHGVAGGRPAPAPSSWSTGPTARSRRCATNTQWGRAASPTDSFELRLPSGGGLRRPARPRPAHGRRRRRRRPLHRRRGAVGVRRRPRRGAARRRGARPRPSATRCAAAARSGASRQRRPVAADRAAGERWARDLPLFPGVVQRGDRRARRGERHAARGSRPTTSPTAARSSRSRCGPTGRHRHAHLPRPRLRSGAARRGRPRRRTPGLRGRARPLAPQLTARARGVRGA